MILTVGSWVVVALSSNPAFNYRITHKWMHMQGHICNITVFLLSFSVVWTWPDWPECTPVPPMPLTVGSVLLIVYLHKRHTAQTSNKGHSDLPLIWHHLHTVPLHKLLSGYQITSTWLKSYISNLDNTDPNFIFAMNNWAFLCRVRRNPYLLQVVLNHNYHRQARQSWYGTCQSCLVQHTLAQHQKHWYALNYSHLLPKCNRK